MHQINLHAHTKNSDGSDSLYKMALKAKELGFSALVVTDHDTTERGTYYENKAELRALRETGNVPLPIIIGCEIKPPLGEYLLFGTKAIKLWTHYRERLKYVYRNFSVDAFVRLFNDLVVNESYYNVSPDGGSITTPLPTYRRPINYALIKCHPDQSAHTIRSIPKEWWDLCHGFEIQNGRRDYGKLTDQADLDMISAYREVMPGCGSFRNSDAHCVEDLEVAWNDTPKPITDETGLIQWVRSFRLRYEETKPYTSKD